jgi:queuine tRNA-ribosyltransferase
LLAGFAVGVGPATGAARETTIAAIDPADLTHPLGARWLERLARSSAPFPSDAPPDALVQVRRHPQFRLPSRAG